MQVVVKNGNVERAMRTLKKNYKKRDYSKNSNKNSILKNHLQKEKEKKQRVSKDIKEISRKKWNDLGIDKYKNRVILVV